MTMFDAVCPMDGRYVGAEEETIRETGPYLTIHAEIRYQLKVECALLEAYAELGLLPGNHLEVLDSLQDDIDPEEVYEEEKTTQHNIRALVNVIQSRLDDALKPFVHLGPTSADITDTARALQVKDFVNNVFLKRLVGLEKNLIQLAEAGAGVTQVGRTHGQHAVPTTFGHAMALFVSRLGNRILALHNTASRLVGKMAGAVGAYNSFSLLHPKDPRAVERIVMKRLGLETSPTGIASQIAEPEPLLDLCHAAVSTFSVIANLADDLRHLMRTEIGELTKITRKGHVGSSTMPHKVNPKDFENVKSLWKAFAPRILTLYADQISEHQRDLTNSASGRFVMELLAGCYYGTVRMERALRDVRMNQEAMKKNLAISRDTFVAEPLYIVSGLFRIPNAYEIIKNLAETARARGVTLSDVVKKDGWPEELDAKCDVETLEILDGILDEPEGYRGLAEQVALETCRHWSRTLETLSGSSGQRT